ncbi:MAG: ABC transporter substrate-binding protein [Candidatus Krumholzibacteria bacterium]|nr:ABC transporter substrate-binding protein [Candidatus Krumholzibacteria bacterium]
MKTLTVGHSPDADDAFMFYALAKKKVTINDHDIEHVMEDIESLNHRALRGDLDVTAISAAVYPLVATNYRIMACGASVGRNYGPIVLCKEDVCINDLAGKRIGVPGSHTTAYLLLRLYMTAPFQPVMLPFDSITGAIDRDQVDAGVIIHEGQITWQGSDLKKILDLGEAWMEDTRLPIPLGLDVVHRKFDTSLQQEITSAMEASIRMARSQEDEAIDYAMEFGRGIDRETCRQFVRMYVNEDTVNMGAEGKQALDRLYTLASERGIIESSPALDIIGLK